MYCQEPQNLKSEPPRIPPAPSCAAEIRIPPFQKISLVFANPFLPQNSFAKTSPNCICTPPARILGGQNPERKTPFPFSKRNPPPPNQKCNECFFFRGCRRTRRAECVCIPRTFHSWKALCFAQRRVARGGGRLHYRFWK